MRAVRLVLGVLFTPFLCLLNFILLYLLYCLSKPSYYSSSYLSYLSAYNNAYIILSSFCISSHSSKIVPIIGFEMYHYSTYLKIVHTDVRHT